MCLAWDHELCPLSYMEKQLDVIREQVGSSKFVCTIGSQKPQFLETFLAATEMLAMLLSIQHFSSSGKIQQSFTGPCNVTRDV